MSSWTFSSGQGFVHYGVPRGWQAVLPSTGDLDEAYSVGAQSMIIETNRLTIRSFLESDIPEYAAIVADPEVTKFLGDGSPHSYEQAAAYVVDCIRSEAEEGIARYAVILRETGELIGFCGFKKVGDYIDFGWRYARRAWGNGYATEAAAAVLDYGINTLKLCGIVVESAVENAASVRVIEKIGMQFEAFGEVRGRKTVRYRQPSGSDRIEPAHTGTTVHLASS